ncbi:hypothetical protein DKG34_39020 [Streptomyces sp. NWU49]|nr:hypothetical protein DKG34_39020 [Streptomyces sp. NWU49]
MDYLGATFSNFVTDVLRPLSPYAVLSGDDMGRAPAEQAAALLGLSTKVPTLGGDAESIRGQVESLLLGTLPA